MKPISTLVTTTILLCSALAAGAQNITIFQPGPGLNDGSDQGGANGGKDAWVYQGDVSTNYGGDTYFLALPVSNCNSTHASAFVQFDVSTLPLVVDSVVFGVTHFEHTNYCISNCNADFYFARNTQAWDEMTINYLNFPTTDTAFYGPVNVTFPNSFGVREYNITPTYLLWRTGAVPNYGFSVYSTTVGCNNAAVYFDVHSSDDTAASTRPYLKIYTGGLGVQTSIAQAIGFHLSPNPAREQARLQFNLEEEGKAAFHLRDVAGREVMEVLNVEGRGRFDLPLELSGLSEGLYFYTLETSEGAVSGKLVH